MSNVREVLVALGALLNNIFLSDYFDQIEPFFGQFILLVFTSGFIGYRFGY